MVWTTGAVPSTLQSVIRRRGEVSIASARQGMAFKIESLFFAARFAAIVPWGHRLWVQLEALAAMASPEAFGVRTTGRSSPTALSHLTARSVARTGHFQAIRSEVSVPEAASS